jgi:ABC-type lipoprotein export system ATPase subunit
MNSELLIPRLAAAFSSCAPLPAEMDMVRCERSYKDLKRSVYFFRRSPTLPDDQELVRIHREIVSPSYFKSQDASRWSHFVIFVADDAAKEAQEFRTRQQQIEDDKNYARKLVIYDSELEEFIDHSVAPIATDAPAQSVANIWSEKLQAAGLGQIEADAVRAPRAPLVRDIRAGTLHREPAPAKTKGSKSTAQTAIINSIRHFHVERYGMRRLSGDFEFGRVNLIRGPNGSGKTSLLEALEVYFCGATFRSDGKPESFTGYATFTDNIAQRVPFKPLSNEQYRQKDQRWYGRTTNRGNRLYEGFARFHFLNTDAAVHFSSKGDLQNLTDALSKIALGPDAAYTWNRIGEFEQDISKELPPLDTSLGNLEKSVATAHARLSALQTVSPQTEVQLGLVNQHLHLLAWPNTELPAAGAEVAWFNQYVALRSFVAAGTGMGAYSSIDAINKTQAILGSDLENLTQLEARKKTLTQERAALDKARATLEERRTRTRRIDLYFRSGFPTLRKAQIESEGARVEISRSQIAASDLDNLLSVAADIEQRNSTLSSFQGGVRERLESARQRLALVEQRRAETQSQLRASDALTADIRALGRRYAELVAHADSCPLCRTDMSMKVLLDRIDRVTGQSDHAAELEKLSKELSEENERIRLLTAASLTATKLAQASPDAPQALLIDASNQSRQLDQRLNDVSVQIAQFHTQMEALRKQGYTDDENAQLIALIQRDLKAVDSKNTIDAETVNQMLSAQETFGVTLDDQESALFKSLEDVDRNAGELSKRHGVLPDSLRKHLQELQDAFRNVSHAFDDLPDAVRQRFSTDIPHLLTNAKQTTKALDELNTQIHTERSRNSEIQVLQRQVAREAEQMRSTKLERDRLAAALAVLHDLQGNHSLNSGLSAFLTGNLDAIQRIFTKIHVPHELTLSNLANCKLNRVGVKEPADLTEISTGQRAALMLSIFLTLNLSLRAGPPIMLIDDPIAHIDDLNALSFLDFLADVAESEKRQIFFATANEKLGNLFQKKMEFLGTEFKTHDLPNPPQS